MIVLGGGVGGMSAAQELAERGFEVTVYETRAIAGGIINPLVDDIDPATLRSALIQLTQRMLKLPD